MLPPGNPTPSRTPSFRATVAPAFAISMGLLAVSTIFISNYLLTPSNRPCSGAPPNDIGRFRHLDGRRMPGTLALNDPKITSLVASHDARNFARQIDAAELDTTPMGGGPDPARRVILVASYGDFTVDTSFGGATVRDGLRLVLADAHTGEPFSYGTMFHGCWSG